MEIKLVINGEDKRVRISPSDVCDKKILEIIAECSNASLETKRESGYYSDKNIQQIDLILKPKIMEENKEE